MKLTKQGVRDLDFGWKKKLVPASVEAAGDGAAGDGEGGSTGASASATAGSAEPRDDAAPAQASA